MCLGVPAKIISIYNNRARADFGGLQKEIRIDLVDVKVGEYVIVHAGYAIEVLNEKEAKESMKLWRKLLSK